MFGALLMTAGILMATLSGMCAVNVLLAGGHGIVPALISFVVGIGVAFLGWALNRA